MDVQVSIQDHESSVESSGFHGVSPTIADKNCSSMIPRLKHLLFQVYSRDPIPWRRVDQIPNNASEIAWEVANLFDHALVGFRAPFRVFKCHVFGSL